MAEECSRDGTAPSQNTRWHAASTMWTLKWKHRMLALDFVLNFYKCSGECGHKGVKEIMGSSSSGQSHN